MSKNRTYNKKNLLIIFFFVCSLIILLVTRLFYLMVYKKDYYGKMAKDVRERERSIKAQRGIIYDRNNVALASNKSVCTISVIHNQITNRDEVIEKLSKILEIDKKIVEKRVDKISSIEKIKSNVDKKLADKIRNLDLDGVMVDEDYKRYYPYNSLASKVIGFTGGDNQGVIGLEVEYEEYLKGTNGAILTVTTANGAEVDNEAENRIEPVSGKDLYTSIDLNIQMYAEQAAKKVLEKKEAKSVKIILMNPQDGEIYAMVNIPEFDLNKPYELINDKSNNSNYSRKEKNVLLNDMWRNACISDTYEPGSTFKIVTATAAFEEKVLKVTDVFHCQGYKMVEDRRIKCHKTTGHGTQTFKEGIKNSCNPVFMEIGARVGTINMYKNYRKLGLFDITKVDLPGEANSIMHNISKIGAVELATMSFGQSIQITPLQLLVAASAVVNGGKLVTPHFGVAIKNRDGNVVKTLKYNTKNNVIQKETSDIMKELLEQVVADGTGKKAYIKGARIGGKTATSEKLPRGTGKYISSFIGFAPCNKPKVMGIVLIDEPSGIYYGGTIAAPVLAEVFDNILDYTNKMTYNR